MSWEFEAWQVAFAIFAVGTAVQFAVVVAACELDWRRPNDGNVGG